MSAYRDYALNSGLSGPSNKAAVTAPDEPTFAYRYVAFERRMSEQFDEAIRPRDCGVR
jgi:hypothetical protein